MAEHGIRQRLDDHLGADAGRITHGDRDGGTIFVVHTWRHRKKLHYTT